MKKTLPDFLRLVSGDMDADNEEPVDLLLAEPIGFDAKTYTGMSSRMFGQAMNGIPKKKPINLLVNTMGGSVSEGVAMHNMILARGNVNTCVIGMAASIGAVVMQAGKKRSMMPGTMVAIHNVQGEGGGDYKDFSSQSDSIKKVQDNLVNLMSQRTGQSKKKISDMMDAVTYMTPEEAEELGFCDEVIDGSAAWNDLERPAPEQVLKTFRTLANTTAVGGEQHKQPKEQKIMKTLTAALAAVGLLPSADLTDEDAIVSAFNNASKPFVDAKQENVTLKAENKAYKDAQKSRVEAAVALAVTNKLIKDDEATKKRYTEMGLRDEAELTASLADLQTLRGDAAPARRGAPPVPPADKAKNDNETKMEALHNEMKDAGPARQVEISRELRELRGHKNLFATAAVVAAK